MLDMASRWPSKLMLLGSLSVASSLVLGLIPFVDPTMPIGLVIFANWLLFMLVGYCASPKPLRFFPPYPAMEKLNYQVWLLVFLSFTGGGWVAIAMGQPMF